MKKNLHDIKNSLTILDIGLKSVNNFLPKLTATYNTAKDNNLLIPEISTEQLTLLNDISAKLEKEIEALQKNLVNFNNVNVIEE